MSVGIQLRFSGGRRPEEHESINAAKEAVLSTWPEAFFWDNHHRVLAWENAERSENDDGAAAVASITWGDD